MPNEDFRHDINEREMPTLFGLADTLKGYGVIFGSLVCPPRITPPFRRAGVLVLMTNAEAIRQLGPYIAQQIERLRGKQNPKSVVMMDPKAPLSEWFKELERVNLYFGWYKHEETGMLIACFSGSPAEGGIVDKDFCDGLTKLGCATSLK